MKEVQHHMRSSGLRRSAEGMYPVAVALAAAMLDPTVNALLAHLPRCAPPVKGAPDSRPESCKRDRSSSAARSSKKKTRPETAAIKDKDRSVKEPASPTKKNIPDVLSSARRPDILPQRPEKRGRFCFPFNLREGCADAEPGGSCKRGWHLCPKAGCHKPHCYVEHHPQG